jgi:hypothetical protein
MGFLLQGPFRMDALYPVSRVCPCCVFFRFVRSLVTELTEPGIYAGLNLYLYQYKKGERGADPANHSPQINI